MTRYKNYTHLPELVRDMCSQKRICIEIPSLASDLNALYGVLECVDKDEYAEYRDMPTMELRAKPIDFLQITLRAYNCLKKAGIKNMRQLIDTNTKELLNIRGLGLSSYYCIIVHMNLLGFKYDEHGWAHFSQAIIEGQTCTTMK